jgi:hypothetical protein
LLTMLAMLTMPPTTGGTMPLMPIRMAC